MGKIERIAGKEVGAVIKDAIRAGARFKNGARGHHVLLLPNGARVSCPSSNGRQATAKQFRKKLRERGLAI